MENSIASQTDNRCVTCEAELTGNFCSNCGEKRLNPSKDYSIVKFLEQTVDGLTHFDSKFLRSFKALLFKPGFLTAEFINGRRTRYMKPVQLFLVASVLFYFVFPKAAGFFFAPIELPKSQHPVANTNLFHVDVKKAIQEKVDEENSKEELVVKEINNEAIHKSKAYLFLMIPFWGLLFYLLYFRSNRFLIPHMIFALHNMASFIVLLILYLLLYTLFQMLFKINFETMDEILLPFAVIYATHLFLSIRKVYQQNIFWSSLKCAASLFFFVIMTMYYRQAITMWALLG